jgi:hypothetical protein
MATIGFPGGPFRYGAPRRIQTDMLSTETVQGPKAVDPMLQGFRGFDGWMDAEDS